MGLADDLQVHALTGPARALADEAVRIKSRLDKLDAIITGADESWLDVQQVAGEMELTINRPLAEARQQALALRAILAELRAVQGVKAAEATPVADPADDLAAARERKRKEAASAT